MSESDSVSPMTLTGFLYPGHMSEINSIRYTSSSLPILPTTNTAACQYQCADVTCCKSANVFSFVYNKDNLSEKLKVK